MNAPATNDTEVPPPRIVLGPGDFRFGAAPLQLATLLGSCVTVTLWHPRRHIGGMCHVVSPKRPQQRDGTLDGRYADEAFALFDEAIARAGCRHAEFQAKLFGGGDMFPGAVIGLGVGERNIAAARELLRSRGIPLLVEHVGGTGRRKLVFDIGTGDVWLYFAGENQDIEPSFHA